MRILIYGGIGFIGANVVEALSGHELYVAHRPGSPQRKPAIAHFVRRHASLVEYVDPAAPLESVRPDAVVNLVGEYFGSPQALWEANAEFPRRLCEAARRAGWSGKVVHVSAATVVGPLGPVIREEERHLEGIRPAGHFDRAKAEGERAVASCFDDWVIVRPALVYGRFNDHPEWRRLVSVVRRGVAPILRASVSAISAREAARAVAGSLRLSRQYFFATECRPRPLADFVKAIKGALKARALELPVPKSLLGLAAPPELRAHLPFLDRAFSCEKMRSLVGEAAPDFQREVEEMVSYILTRSPA